jgi:hypothetical protein
MNNDGSRPSKSYYSFFVLSLSLVFSFLHGCVPLSPILLRLVDVPQQLKNQQHLGGKNFDLKTAVGERSTYLRIVEGKSQFNNSFLNVSPNKFLYKLHHHPTHRSPNMSAFTAVHNTGIPSTGAQLPTVLDSSATTDSSSGMKSKVVFSTSSLTAASTATMATTAPTSPLTAASHVPTPTSGNSPTLSGSTSPPTNNISKSKRNTSEIN